MNLTDGRLEQLRQQCTEFHEKHPEVWQLFVKFSLEMIDRGYQNYSVNAVFERIRWEIDAGGDGTSSFKLNNNYRAFYSRRFMRAYPQFDGFYRIRRQASEDVKASNLPELRPSDYQHERI